MQLASELVQYSKGACVLEITLGYPLSFKMCSTHSFTTRWV